jgi:hypothetical protein
MCVLRDLTSRLLGSSGRHHVFPAIKETLMKLRSAVAAAAAVALIAVTAPRADALWAPPNRAPTRDASGAANGCTASVPELVVRQEAGIGYGILIKRQVTCPASAKVKRVSESGSLSEVMADGSLLELAAQGQMGSAANSAGIVGTTWAANFIDCTLRENRGAHTYVVKGRITTRTTTSISDTNPFIAKVGRIQTVTCP